MEEIAEYSGVTTTDGKKILTYEFIETLREADKKMPNPQKIIAQRGGQEKFLSTMADIVIYGGKRGGAKSFSLLLEAQHDIQSKYFNSIIFRNEINDLTDLITTSYQIYDDFGKYNKSKGDMTWNFNWGGWLEFNYYSDSIEDFKKRFQGRQFSYIGCLLYTSPSPRDS